MRLAGEVAAVAVRHGGLGTRTGSRCEVIGMSGDALTGLRPDLYERLAATNPFASRARKLFGRGQVMAVRGNEADLQVGYDARGNALELEQVPIVSGYAPQVGDWVAIGYEAGQAGAPWVMGPSMGADASADATGIGVFAVRTSDPAGAAASTIYFDESRGVWRGYDGTEWVDFGGSGQVTAHNALSGLQGGEAGEYYHLTAAEYGGTWGHGLDAVQSAADYSLKGRRLTALTNVSAGTVYSVHTTSGDMVDGFGVRHDLAIEDATSGPFTIGQVAALRDGADNTGKFSWRVMAAGVLAERMSLTSAGALSISGALTATGATLTGSTAGRVAFYGVGGVMSEAAGLAWDGSYLTASSIKDSALTAGSVLFAGASGLISQDNANLFWDDANNRLGIGTGTPSYTLDVAGTALVGRGVGDGGAALILGIERTWAFKQSGTGANTHLQLICTSTNKHLLIDTDGSVFFRKADGTQGVAINASSGYMRGLDGSATAPTYSDLNDTNTGLYFPAADTMGVTLGGTERFRWSGNNIGMVSGAAIHFEGVAATGDTYITGDTTNAIMHVCGGLPALKVSNSGVAMPLAGIGFFSGSLVGRQPHIDGPSGGQVIDMQARAKINDILSQLETLNLFASA